MSPNKKKSINFLKTINDDYKKLELSGFLCFLNFEKNEQIVFDYYVRIYQTEPFIFKNVLKKLAAPSHGRLDAAPGPTGR